MASTAVFFIVKALLSGVIIALIGELAKTTSKGVGVWVFERAGFLK